ncbi:MAG: DUF427 domain-containing protein [Nitriliruptoraceae bacterium]|nr:DUF427 domain-containing protein [Nitriliruptoraceae bacterium]
MRGAMRRPQPEEPGPGQESVWDYPRPPAVAPTDAHVCVWFAGQLIADTRAAIRVMETSHPPSFYLPRADIDTSALVQVARRTFCEFKGEAAYADLVVGEQRSPLACWWYLEPTPGYEALRDTMTFYPSRVERATVDGEQVRSSEGDFYGGWITSKVTGPFKGAPGTMWW